MKRSISFIMVFCMLLSVILSPSMVNATLVETSIKSKVAKDYLELINSIVNKYGVIKEGLDYSLDIDVEHIKGFRYAQLEDFDNDGIEELILIYNDSSGYEDISFQVWGHDGTKPYLMFYNKNSIYDYDKYPFVSILVDSPEIGIIEIGGKSYFYIENENGTGQEFWKENIYYTVKNGQWILEAYLRSDEIDEDGYGYNQYYSIDDKEVSQKEYEQALLKFKKEKDIISPNLGHINSIKNFNLENFSRVLKEIANSSSTDKPTEFKDPNEYLNAYIEYLEGISTDQLSAGLLKYNTKLDPALVVMYTETEETYYVEDNYLHIKVLTQVNGRVHESYTKTYSNDGALADSEYEWNILTDAKSGIDYIEIKSSELGQDNIYDHTNLYQFTGKNLVDILSKSGEHINADSNPNSKMEYTYRINGKETSKIKYDNEIKNKKIKYKLVGRSMGPTLDYYNIAAPIYNELQPSLYLNNNTRIKANPIIINGRTLVPLRALLEEMGATVEWDNGTKTVKTRRDSTNIIMKIGSDNATVNGKTVKLDVAAQLIDGVTYIPARFVGESFNYKVTWIQKTKTVLINSN